MKKLLFIVLVCMGLGLVGCTPKYQNMSSEEKIALLQGTYDPVAGEEDRPIIISGDTLTHIDRIDDYEINYSEKSIDLNENGFSAIFSETGIIYGDYTVASEKDKVYLTFVDGDENSIYKKVSDSVDLPQVKQAEEDLPQTKQMEGELSEELLALQGTWESENDGAFPFVINGTDMTYISKISDDDIVYFERSIELTEHGFNENFPRNYSNVMDEFSIIEDGIVRRSKDLVIYKKVSDSTEIPKEKTQEIKKEPTIGMTKEEVENSSWGLPKDINKTTNKYGVREQWVYGDNRYIYFEDGIVTTIQE